MTQERTYPTKKRNTKAIRHFLAHPKASNASQFDATLNEVSCNDRNGLETIKMGRKGRNFQVTKRTNTTTKASTKAIRLSHAYALTPRRSPLNATSNDALHRRKQA